MPPRFSRAVLCLYFFTVEVNLELRMGQMTDGAKNKDVFQVDSGWKDGDNWTKVHQYIRLSCAPSMSSAAS